MPRSFNKITRNWVNGFGIDFTTKDQFHLNLLVYCKVGQFNVQCRIKVGAVDAAALGPFNK